MDVVISKRPKLDLDPDYKEGYDLEAKRRFMVEESGQGQAQQCVVEVVVRELDLALTQKESEVLQLQERVQGCQQALCLLRMGVTSAFYGNISAPEASGGCAPYSEGQSACHPAISRLFKYTTTGSGRKTRDVCNKYSTDRHPEVVDDTSRGSSDAERTSTEESKEKERCGSDNEEVEQERGEEPVEREQPTLVKIPRYIPPLMPKPPEVCAASVRMERHRIKRRLVVGNVSKWLPDDVREDASSHKWMLYLRGPKDSPDLSDVVAKVRYFLHPSYRPHDIVDVVHPFYLARRGWGEFPVRVQVHFSIDGNRPIDIIHNLKLDRTYSGLQTLGGETVVDVWLKNVQSNQSIEEDNAECCQNNIQKQSSAESTTTISCDRQPEIVPHAAERPAALVTQQAKGEMAGVAVKGENGKEEGRMLERELETIPKILVEVKKEPEDDGGIVQNDKDSCEQYRSLVNSFVVHTLPDHDYLGNNSFKLRCTSCVDQSKLHSVSEVKSSKKENAQNATFSGQTFDKAEEAASKVDDNNKSKVTGSGILSNSTFVQCVDFAGNILYIGLQRPVLSKCELQRDTKTKICNQEILMKNVQVSPSAFVHAGQSLLKKNFGIHPLSLSPEKCHMPCLSEVVQPKLSSGKSHSQLQKLDIKPDTYNLLKEATLTVPRILDDCRAVIWLLRQLPLADERVNKDIAYKKQHPYCASNIANFLAWPVGKRHCAERLRANEAHIILQTIDSQRFAKWSVRHIMTWSRLHALTPLPMGKCVDQVEKKHLPISSFRPTVSEPSEVQDWLESIAEASRTAEELEDVNVVDVPPFTDFKTTAEMEHTSKCVTVWMPSESNLFKFVQETVKQIDIRLVAETLCQGVQYPAAEELLCKAFLSFSEDLLRRSVHQAWKRCQKMPNEIVLVDVQNALLSHSEFDIFTNTGLGVQTYASQL